MLCLSNQTNSQPNGSSSVLSLHKNKPQNKRPIPTPTQLSIHAQSLGCNIHNLASPSHQASLPSSISPSQVSVEPDSGTDTGTSTSSEGANANYRSKSSLARRTRRSPAISTPANLGYYSPRSKSILKEAKLKYRIYIATTIAFPTTAQAIEHGAIKYNLTCDEYATDTESERGALPPIDTGRIQVVS
jgi:hypothetical protein